jgi:uroporphyrin-III C-methyltransferase / precorrin-2 dehydrogenase / sirohydrochlorin ferrochelatase
MSHANEASKSLFPAFLQLRGKAVLVIGGGAVAKRKIAALLDAGATISVVAHALDPEVADLANHQLINYLSTEFDESQIDGVWLVIAASSDDALNARVAAACDARQRWCNVVDRTELCSFQVPARIQRGDLQIAISSAGKAPMLARFVREKLEQEFDESYGQLTNVLADVREGVRDQLSVGQRRAFFDAILQSDIAPLLRNSEIAQARVKIERLLASYQNQNNSNKTNLGRVALVGAGPGDAGLLTLRALRMLNLADVILTDQLVSKDVLALARRDAEIEFVGKKGGAHCTPQAAIQARMLALAREGKFVVRLKGGDPFVFGRGGEELEFLRAHHIGYEVVPGITAALACAAYTGVPLTHRDHAQSVRLVTAHCQQSLDNLDWQALAAERQTLVFYMGVSNLISIQHQLIAHGRDAKTPVLIVENGSRADQRSLHTTLGQLTIDAITHHIKAPSLLIIGEVATLAPKLRWFGEMIEGAHPNLLGSVPHPIPNDASPDLHSMLGT